VRRDQKEYDGNTLRVEMAKGAFKTASFINVLSAWRFQATAIAKKSKFVAVKAAATPSGR
jgi:hypothetical protein